MEWQKIETAPRDGTQTAKAMRMIAITAMDETRELYYGKKINSKESK